MEKLILVDENDKEIGTEEKIAAHLGQGKLHRAFAFFIYNEKGEFLLQKRSNEKMLWPLFWDSGASHPYQNEGYEEAGERRLKEELGFDCVLKLVGKFQYQAVFENVGSENEICAVLVGEHNGEVKPNPAEVADWKWVDIKEIKEDIAQNPQIYAPWFVIGFETFYKFFNKK